jgi:hypothetical protein
MLGDLAATTRIYGLSPIFAKVRVELRRPLKSFARDRNAGKSNSRIPGVIFVYQFIGPD